MPLQLRGRRRPHNGMREGPDEGRAPPSEHPAETAPAFLQLERVRVVPNGVDGIRKANGLAVAAFVRPPGRVGLDRVPSGAPHVPIGAEEAGVLDEELTNGRRLPTRRDRHQGVQQAHAPMRRREELVMVEEGHPEGVPQELPALVGRPARVVDEERRESLGAVSWTEILAFERALIHLHEVHSTAGHVWSDDLLQTRRVSVAEHDKVVNADQCVEVEPLFQIAKVPWRRPG
mmetsp:Transcript_31375/g.97692  ORF Transcript_31375/g.97692 Transcript_31375/m.97692 type:complete len:232 (+) Transcript_31375:47-742(+)